VLPANNRDPRDLVEPERMLRRCQRALLGAQPEPVAGILHVGAGHHLAVDRFDRTADMEARVRRIGLRRSFARKLDQLFICYALVLKAAHGACASPAESQESLYA